jgi:hypothetical protein
MPFTVSFSNAELCDTTVVPDRSESPSDTSELQTDRVSTRRAKHRGRQASHHLSRRRSTLPFTRAVCPSPLITDLLQWSVSGFRTRLPDLQALIHGRSPAIVCLQETRLRCSHALGLCCCTTHRYDHPNGDRVRGGTAILERDCICCVPVRLRSPLEIIAVRVHIPNPRFTLCDIHLPPAVTLCLADWRIYCHSYHHHLSFLAILMPSIFSGGANLTDYRETLVYDICADFYLILFNTCAHMHLCLGSGTSSAVDLTFVVRV